MSKSTAIAPFSDRRAFVVPHDNPDSSSPLDCVVTTQGEYTPTHIRVGVKCSDETLQLVWEERARFPLLTLEQLKRARDGESSAVEVAA